MRLEQKDKISSYRESLYNPEQAWLAELHESLIDQRRFMQLGVTEVRFLQFLVALYQPKLIVEFGTLIGYSALAMAQELNEDGRIITFESNPEHVAIAQKHFKKYPGGHKIMLMGGDAHQQLREIKWEQNVDMVFIDADKGGYPDYLNWAEENLKPGGLIVADNTLLFGAVLQDKKPDGVSMNSYKAMQEFNLRLADKTKYLAVMIPSDEGVTVAIKR
ncbi:MAG: O-methyltransferase [Alphaproteobacteria bacterium]|nr:O-methyltransferase [Alphaproteobacteria bacterium]